MEINLENFAWDEDQLSEVFALPVGLTTVADLNGEKLYGSERLNASFLKAVSKNARIKPVINQISRLVDKGKINPVFYDKGLLKFVAWKVFAPLNQKYSVAFYVLKSDKVYLVLSNTANIFTHVPNDMVSMLMVHELIHMFAKSKPEQFKAIWMDTFIEYYKQVYFILFDIEKQNIPTPLMKKIINHQIKFFDSVRTLKGVPASAFMKYKGMMMELQTKSPLSPKQFEELVSLYIYLGYLHRSDTSRWAKEWKRFNSIVQILRLGYRHAFNLPYTSSICTQEIIIPSEVAAICSEYPKFFKKAHQSIAKI
ncbi:MAG: hypothetical protein ACTSWJ_11035 [Candidatus Heimdallarchaeaceae archaeon]